MSSAKRDLKGYFLPASAALQGGGGEGGDGRGGREGKGESSASKQVPAPSAPTYKNLFLPHVMATDIIYVITHDR